MELEAGEDTLKYTVGYHSTALEALHAHEPAKLLKDDQLEAGSWSEPHPDWNKPTVKATGTLSGKDLGNAVDRAVVNLSIWRLIHQSRSHLSHAGPM